MTRDDEPPSYTCRASLASAFPSSLVCDCWKVQADLVAVHRAAVGGLRVPAGADRVLAAAPARHAALCLSHLTLARARLTGGTHGWTYSCMWKALKSRSEDPWMDICMYVE